MLVIRVYAPSFENNSSSRESFILVSQQDTQICYTASLFSRGNPYWIVKVLYLRKIKVTWTHFSIKWINTVNWVDKSHGKGWRSSLQAEFPVMTPRIPHRIGFLRELWQGSCYFWYNGKPRNQEVTASTAGTRTDWLRLNVHLQNACLDSVSPSPWHPRWDTGTCTATALPSR